jgi:hypothetical protein
MFYRWQTAFSLDDEIKQEIAEAAEICSLFTPLSPVPRPHSDRPPALIRLDPANGKKLFCDLSTLNFPQGCGLLRHGYENYASTAAGRGHAIFGFYRQPHGAIA